MLQNNCAHIIKLLLLKGPQRVYTHLHSDRKIHMKITKINNNVRFRVFFFMVLQSYFNTKNAVQKHKHNISYKRSNGSSAFARTWKTGTSVEHDDYPLVLSAARFWPLVSCSIFYQLHIASTFHFCNKLEFQTKCQCKESSAYAHTWCGTNNMGGVNFVSG